MLLTLKVGNMSGANEVKLEELIQQALAGGGGGEGGGAGAAAAGGDAGEDDCGVAGQVSKTYNLQVVKHYKTGAIGNNAK